MKMQQIPIQILLTLISANFISYSVLLRLESNPWLSSLLHHYGPVYFLFMSHHLPKSWPGSTISHILGKYFSSIFVKHMTPMGGNSYECLSLSDNYLDYVIGSKLIWILFLRAYDWKHITSQGWKITPDSKSSYEVHISSIPASLEIVPSLRNIFCIVSKMEKVRNNSDDIETFRSLNWEI